jgi:transposase-like protein
MKRKHYSAADKLRFYKEYQNRQNMSEVARIYGIDLSYLREIISECDQVLLTHFRHKKVGRKKADEPQDIPEAVQQISTLKSQYHELAKEKEELYIKNEFMKLQLSWAQRDGYTVKNRHLKKKRKKK